MNSETSIDKEEIAKFTKMAGEWWNPEGPLKTLHDINPLRLEFVGSQVDLAGKKILDLGCGGGIFSEALAGQGASITGMDADSEAIAAAVEHAEGKNLALTYICSPIEDYEGPLFDAITCMEMLEHVQEPEQIIRHCARLLKPGGMLFLSTINRSLKAYAQAVLAAEYLLNLLPRQTHDYEKFIRPAELAGMLRRAGFEVQTLRGMAYNPWTRRAHLQDSVEVNYLISSFLCA